MVSILSVVLCAGICSVCFLLSFVTSLSAPPLPDSGVRLFLASENRTLPDHAIVAASQFRVDDQDKSIHDGVSDAIWCQAALSLGPVVYQWYGPGGLPIMNSTTLNNTDKFNELKTVFVVNGTTQTGLARPKEKGIGDNDGLYTCVITDCNGTSHILVVGVYRNDFYYKNTHTAGPVVSSQATVHFFLLSSCNADPMVQFTLSFNVSNSTATTVNCSVNEQFIENTTVSRTVLSSSPPILTEVTVTISQWTGGVYNCTVSNDRVEKGTLSADGTNYTATPGHVILRINEPECIPREKYTMHNKICELITDVLTTTTVNSLSTNSVTMDNMDSTYTNIPISSSLKHCPNTTTILFTPNTCTNNSSSNAGTEYAVYGVLAGILMISLLVNVFLVITLLKKRNESRKGKNTSDLLHNNTALELDCTVYATKDDTDTNEAEYDPEYAPIVKKESKAPPVPPYECANEELIKDNKDNFYDDAQVVNKVTASESAKESTRNSRSLLRSSTPISIEDRAEKNPETAGVFDDNEYAMVATPKASSINAPTNKQEVNNNEYAEITSTDSLSGIEPTPVVVKKDEGRSGKGYVNVGSRSGLSPAVNTSIDHGYDEITTETILQNRSTVSLVAKASVPDEGHQYFEISLENENPSK